MQLEVKPLTPARWTDLEAIFSARGLTKAFVHTDKSMLNSAF